MKEIIIEVSDDFGELLKPYKEDCTIIGQIFRCKDCLYGDAEYPYMPPNQYLCHYHGSDWNNGEHYCGYAKKR